MKYNQAVLLLDIRIKEILVLIPSYKLGSALRSFLIKKVFSETYSLLAVGFGKYF